MCGISLSPTINKDWGWEKRDRERNKSGKDKREEETRLKQVQASGLIRASRDMVGEANLSYERIKVSFFTD